MVEKKLIRPWKTVSTKADHFYVLRFSTYPIKIYISCSLVSDSSRPPWTVAHQAPLSMEFSWQEYWSGLPFPFPAYLPDPGIERRFPALWADFRPSETPGKPSSKDILQDVASRTTTVAPNGELAKRPLVEGAA